MTDRATLTGRLALGLAALTAWELAARRAELRRAGAAGDYWRGYYDAATLGRADALRQVAAIRSAGVSIHLDIYPHPDPEAPVVVISHGGAGYCRLFVPLALRFHQRGYAVVLPDQRGQGLSGGARGDYTIAECAQNIVDAARWARGQFRGPVHLAGGSVGGALSYYAAAAGAPVAAIACLNLFDFGGDDALRFSRLAPLAALPGGPGLVRALLRLLRPVDWLRLPGRWLARFDRLMDDRDAAFQRRWDADPIPPARLSLRQVASNLTTPPAVPFERNTVPTLVLNQARDRMVDPAITRRNYERLGGPKRYAELDYGHWSSAPAFWDEVVAACDDWFREHAAPANAICNMHHASAG
ncbi:MAG TPA: alpha/beta fold hydrolase [Chloroflexaceae bacterium]|nr:alpha/beta fold hydrolase [Chloroflexaceae bacterium]